VCLDHVASRIVNAGHGVTQKHFVKLRSAISEEEKSKEKTSMKTTIQRFVSTALRKSTRSKARRFPAILLLSFLAVCPTEARADCGDTGDIQFTVTLLAPLAHRPNGNKCFIVKGPYFRRNYGVTIGDLTPGQPCTFYAADDNLLSPYGSWDAEISPTCLPPLIAGLVQHNSFWLERPARRVNITLDDRPNGRFTVNVSTGGNQQAEALGMISGDSMGTAGHSQATSARQVSVKSWLGDSTGGPDSDKFRFLGNAGDSITVRLEPDTRGGSNGGQVTLRFMGPPARQVTAALTIEHPHTITVQLDSTRDYDIAVEQSEEQGELRYRGGYIQTVESAQGNPHRLQPLNSVEK